MLFVHGSDDPVVPVAHTRGWAGQLPGACLAEFAGARHDVLNETVHREVAAAITGFVLEAGDRSAAAQPAAAGHRFPAPLQPAPRQPAPRQPAQPPAR